MLNFSPNMLKTFAECPKKFNFKFMQKISVPQKTTPFEKGKKVHALANYYLKGDDITKFEQVLTPDERQAWNTLKSNTYFQKNCLKSEYNLSAKTGDFWIGGRIDALMNDGAKYFILDYKTGAIPQIPETDFQTMVYLLCADKKIKHYESLEFIYVDLKNNKNYVVKFDDTVKKSYEEEITRICTQIKKANSFPPFDGDKCKFCEYKKICL